MDTHRIQYIKYDKCLDCSDGSNLECSIYNLGGKKGYGIYAKKNRAK